MSAKKPDIGKWVRRDSHTGQYVPTKDTGNFTKKEERTVTVPDKKDSGGTDSTGPRREKRKNR